MKNCENLNVLELVEKAKQLEDCIAKLDILHYLLKQYHSKLNSWDEDFREDSKSFAELNLKAKFDKLINIIEIGTADDIIKSITEERKELARNTECQKQEFLHREEELLNAWNNFQSWKSQTSANLIKDLNLKFKENV